MFVCITHQRLMKKLYIILSICLAGFAAQAQQLPLFSEFSHNSGIINPAMTGWDNIMALTASYRHQWTGMQGAPRTASLNFRHYFDKQNMGAGVYFMHDQTGPTSFTGANFTYAYHLKFKPEKKGEYVRNRLAIGLSLSAIQYRLRGSQLQVNDTDDDLLFSNNQSKFLPDAGLGLFYYNDMFYVGFAVPQIISMKVRFEGANGLSNMRRIAHIYTHAGFKINLNKGSRERYLGDHNKQDTSRKKEAEHLLLPSVWLKYAPSSPLNASLHLKYMWNRVFGAGLGFSSDGTMNFDFDVNIKKQFRLSYAFSFGINGLAKYLGTNHEVMFTYIVASNGKSWVYDKCGNLNFDKKKEKTPKEE